MITLRCKSESIIRSIYFNWSPVNKAVWFQNQSVTSDGSSNFYCSGMGVLLHTLNIANTYVRSK